MDLSARHRITAYDANFMALAMEMDVLCITEDGELHAKFPTVALSMADFLRQSMAGGEVREPYAPYGGRKRKPAARR